MISMTALIVTISQKLIVEVNCTVHLITMRLQKIKNCVRQPFHTRQYVMWAVNCNVRVVKGEVEVDAMFDCNPWRTPCLIVSHGGDLVYLHYVGIMIGKWRFYRLISTKEAGFFILWIDIGKCVQKLPKVYAVLCATDAVRVIRTMQGSVSEHMHVYKDYIYMWIRKASQFGCLMLIKYQNGG